MIDAPTPSISVIRCKSSDMDVLALLTIAICDLSDFFNVGKNMCDKQVAKTAELILEDFGHLKLEEIKYCFDEAMKHGKLFDRLDGNIIIGWLKDYDQKRTETAIQLSEEDDKLRIAQEAEAAESTGMSWQEFCDKLKADASNGDEDALSKIKLFNIA